MIIVPILIRREIAIEFVDFHKNVNFRRKMNNLIPLNGFNRLSLVRIFHLNLFAIYLNLRNKSIRNIQIKKQC